MSPDNDLARRLGAGSALAVLVSVIIGSGIFRVPRAIAAATGSPGAVLLCWVIGGIVTMCAALSVAELSTMFPRAGGMYVYLREAYGDRVAFMLGWVNLLALPLSQAAIALVFAGYLRTFVGLDELGVRMVAAGLIGLVAFINYRSLRLAAILQNIGTPGKVLALVTLSITILVFGHRGGAMSETPFTWMPRSIGGFGIALVAVLYAYDGWAQFSSLAGEVRDPGRTLPRVLVGGMSIVIVVYLAANWAYLSALRIDEMAVSPIVAADALSRAIGNVAGSLVSAMVMLSAFGALNSLMMTEPRFFFAMARDGLFFRSISAIHPRNQTPHRAVVLSAMLAFFYVGFRSFEQLAESFVIATSPLFTLAVAGVLVLRRRRPDLPRPYRTPGYPIVPLVYVGGGIFIVANALIQHPVSTGVSFAVTLLGVPIFAVWSRRPAARRAAVPASQVLGAE
ncbi:MAG TPA: amino acid permease [Gemmatimonadaceae bacterium]|jgi:amino acid transporter|nr:amino acid permease [Gemmatimonadaceae bacterium]